MPRKQRHIDIYTDGSWLSPDRKGQCGAGGWAAVVIEEGRAPRYIAGVADASIGTSPQIEQFAALSALLDVRQNEWAARKPGETFSITLHSDQVSNTANAPRLRKAFQEGRFSDMDQRMVPLLRLAEEMGVDFKYARDPKANTNPKVHALPESTAWISKLDRMASAHAYKDRLQKQGFLILSVKGRLEGEAAAQAVERMMAAAQNNLSRGR